MQKGKLTAYFKDRKDGHHESYQYEHVSSKECFNKHNADDIFEICQNINILPEILNTFFPVRIG